MEQAFAEARSAGKCCGICMENIRDKSLRFGILNNCRHCFCLECIRSWRKNQGFETKVVRFGPFCPDHYSQSRSCPECRQHSDFVIPSTIWVEEDEEKNVLLELYKENTGQKQCKYYKVNLFFFFFYKRVCRIAQPALAVRLVTNASTNISCLMVCLVSRFYMRLFTGTVDPGESPHVRRRPLLSEFIFRLDWLFLQNRTISEWILMMRMATTRTMNKLFVFWAPISDSTNFPYICYPVFLSL